MKLVIGNKNYSSWSMRPWLLLTAFEVPFEEIKIFLYRGAWREELAAYTSAGKVPVLNDKSAVIWDSLAICEYVSEQYLAGRGWPADPLARAEARSCCAEMHSGFFAIRNIMPMNCRASGRKVKAGSDLKAEINRIDALWSELRQKYLEQGPWLFGDFSIADCMFAPVVSRFHTYGIKLGGNSGEYMRSVLNHHCVRTWIQHSCTETEVINASEVG